MESTHIGSIPDTIDCEPRDKATDNDSEAAEDMPILRSNKKRKYFYSFNSKCSLVCCQFNRSTFGFVFTGPNRIIDSDSSADFSDAQSDNTWSSNGSGYDSSSSENEKENIGGRRTKKATTSKSFADTLIYLDLTNVEADVDPDHSSPNATPEELEKITKSLLIDNFLDSCEFKKKVYQPNPAKKNEK